MIVLDEPLGLAFISGSWAPAPTENGNQLMASYSRADPRRAPRYSGAGIYSVTTQARAASIYAATVSDLAAACLLSTRDFERGLEAALQVASGSQPSPAAREDDAARYNKVRPSAGFAQR